MDHSIIVMLPCMKIALPHSHHSSTSYAKKKIKKLKNLETSLPQETNKNNSSELFRGETIFTALKKLIYRIDRICHYILRAFQEAF